MKSFFYWTAADEKNQRPKGSVLSMINADVSGPRRLPRGGQRIPIAFLDADAIEEQPLPIRVGVVKLLRKRVSQQGFPRAVYPVLGCP